MKKLLQLRPGEAQSALGAAALRLIHQGQRSDLYKYRDDPVGFCREVLGDELWSKQNEILAALHQPPRRVLVQACFDSGKTRTGSRAVIHWVATDPAAIAITTAVVGRQVKGQLWGEIRRVLETGKMPGELSPAELLPGGIMPKSPEWSISATNFALGFSTRNPSAFAGWHGGRVLMVLDQAEGIDAEIWKVLEGSQMSADVAVLALGNPLHTEGGFYKAAKSGTWKVVRISAFDTPNLVAGKVVLPELVTAEGIATVTKEWGTQDPYYVGGVLGKFPEKGARIVVALSDWEEMLQRETLREVQGPLEAGLDVARFGDSWTALVVRQGPFVLMVDRVQGLSGTAAAGWVIDRWRDLGFERLKGDAIGVGGPVLDILREEDHFEVIDVEASGAPNDTEHFYNQRAEMWWALREWVESDMVFASSVDTDWVDLLRPQVTGPHYSFDRRGRRLVESKDEMEKRGLRSPDLADALALSAYEPPYDTDALVELPGRPRRISPY